MRVVHSSLLALLTVLVLSGCHHRGGCVDPDPDPRDTSMVGKVLFEVSYTNYAWTFDHRGMYVDNEGRIYTYRWAMNGPDWKMDSSGIFTEAELMANYAPGSASAGTIRRDSLDMMIGLMEAASRGSYTDTTMTAADAGVTHISLYRYDPANQVYRQTALRQRGDYSFDNLSPSAQKLADILDQRWQGVLR